MLVPTAQENLRKAHAAFRETSRHETVVGKRAGLLRLRPIEIPGGLRFVGKISELRHRRLHAKRHLVLGNPRVDLRIADPLEQLAVQVVDPVDHRAPHIAGDALRVVEVQHGIAARTQGHRRMLGRKKPRGPQPVRERLHIRPVRHLRGHNDKRRQLGIHRTEPIGEPRTDRRLAGKHIAGRQLQDRRLVIDRVGMERLDHAQFVGNFCGVGEELRHEAARFPLPGKFVETRCNRKTRLARRHARERLATTHGLRQILVEQIGEGRLVVPRLNLRGRARHEEVDRAFRFRRIVRQHRGRSGDRCIRQQIGRRATEERREPRPTERFHALPKEVPARLQIEPFAFQAERHVRQIPHGRILAAVIGAEVMIGRGGIHGL